MFGPLSVLSQSYQLGIGIPFRVKPEREAEDLSLSSARFRIRVALPESIRNIFPFLSLGGLVSVACSHLELITYEI
jgi:hypothetical protein